MSDPTSDCTERAVSPEDRENPVDLDHVNTADVSDVEDAEEPVQTGPAELRIQRLDKLFTEDSEEVNVMAQRIVNFSEVPLQKCRNVRCVVARQNLIHKIPPFPDSVRDTIEELDFYDNKIRHIRNVDAVTSLTHLDLSFNNIRTVDNLEAIAPRLKVLYLVQNKILDLGSSLKGMVNLELLELGANRIRDIGESLSDLRSLTSLWLGKNKLTTEGIAGPKLISCVNLRQLSLQNNRLTSIPANVFSHMPHLEELYLSENGIKTMENLEGMPKLKILDVARNEIDTIAGISHLSNLEDFWANNNAFSSWKNVQTMLAPLKQLTGVHFGATPLAKDPRYRARMKDCVPQLKEIDTLAVGTSLPIPPVSMKIKCPPPPPQTAPVDPPAPSAPVAPAPVDPPAPSAPVPVDPPAQLVSETVVPPEEPEPEVDPTTQALHALD